MDDMTLVLETKWVVTLMSGDVISICADGTFVDGADQVFEVLVGRKPPKRVEVARVAHDRIKSMFSDLN